VLNPQGPSHGLRATFAHAFAMDVQRLALRARAGGWILTGDAPSADDNMRDMQCHCRRVVNREMAATHMMCRVDASDGQSDALLHAGVTGVTQELAASHARLVNAMQ
jgi:hypothetical protein